MKQDVKKTSQNDSYRKSMKDIAKKISKTTAGKKAQDIVKKAYSVIDKAAKKNIIHKNKAARLKSKVSKLTK